MGYLYEFMKSRIQKFKRLFIAQKVGTMLRGWFSVSAGTVSVVVCNGKSVGLGRDLGN